MASSIINSDDGSVSGTTGLKTTGGDDGELAFESSGTEAMRIDSSGNVGVGTTSPTAKLSVDGSAVFNESGADVDFRIESDTNTHALAVDAGTSQTLINTATPGASDIDLQIDSMLGFATSNANASNKIFSKYLSLSDNVAATFLTINLPAMDGYDFTNIGIEISYVAYADRETSNRTSRSTYGKVYLSVSRHWNNSGDAPVTLVLDDTDKELATTSSFTITWAASVTSGGVDQSEATIEVTALVNNPSSGIIYQGIVGTVTAHIYDTNTEVTMS